ncbi:MAG: hypothetical protein ACRCZQ_10195 [Bacteroidales bacterium]
MPGEGFTDSPFSSHDGLAVVGLNADEAAELFNAGFHPMILPN